jgi:hypothetical protein
MRRATRSFPSPNLGVRRLAVVVAILGAVGGLSITRARLQSVFVEHGDYQYRLSQIAAHPQWRLARDGLSLWRLDVFGPYYAGDKPYRVWNEAVAFEPGSDQPPRVYEYLIAALPAIAGAFLPWLAIHAVAWIVTGFRSGTPRDRVG